MVSSPGRRRIPGSQDAERLRELGRADDLDLRPDREQVVTHRESVATTLQALELTNGARLAGMLEHGAAYWLSRTGSTAPDKLIDAIYRAGLGRAPTTAELAAGRELVGSPMTKAGVEDLLWVVVMLPEFQLID